MRWPRRSTASCSEITSNVRACGSCSVQRRPAALGGLPPRAELAVHHRAGCMAGAAWSLLTRAPVARLVLKVLQDDLAHLRQRRHLVVRHQAALVGREVEDQVAVPANAESGRCPPATGTGRGRLVRARTTGRCRAWSRSSRPGTTRGMPAFGARKPRPAPCQSVRPVELFGRRGQRDHAPLRRAAVAALGADPAHVRALPMMAAWGRRRRIRSYQAA